MSGARSSPASGPPVVAGFEADPLRRYDEPLVKSSQLQAQLRRAGFAVLPPVIPEGRLCSLVDLGHDFVKRLREPYGELFLAAGRISDSSLRGEVTDAAGNLVREHLRPLFVSGTEILGAAFQVKPPSDRSQLNPHQDSSLLDEASRPGIYCWVPLVDVDERNGWLEVLPGSHRLGNVQRTLNVPWQFAGQEEVFVGIRSAFACRPDPCVCSTRPSCTARRRIGPATSGSH